MEYFLDFITVRYLWVWVEMCRHDITYVEEKGQLVGVVSPFLRRGS